MKETREKHGRSKKKTYDFTGKSPKEPLTKDELIHFKEGMSLKNTSFPADKIDFERAVRIVSQDLDRLLP